MAQKQKKAPTLGVVPKEEEPYKVPENWRWVRLESFASIKTGKKDANYGSPTGKYPFFTCASKPIRCDGYSFDSKAILLAGNGDIGNISMYEGKFEAYQRTYVLFIEPKIITEYVFYFFILILNIFGILCFPTNF